MNPEKVREEKLKKESITFGDATRERVLNHAYIKNAYVLAILINDQLSTLRVIEQARKLNPKILIFSYVRRIEFRAAYCMTKYST